MFDFFKDKVGIFVDGPNMIRKEIRIDLREVYEKAKKYGRVKYARVYLDQYASKKLIEAVINQGFIPVITSGDVDVALATDIIYFALTKGIKKIVIVTRDTDFVPVVERLNESDKDIYVFTVKTGMSKALKNHAKELIILEKIKEEKEMRKNERHKKTV